MLMDDLARLAPENDADRDERAFLISELLRDAAMAAQQKVGLRKWWWGTEIERAWARLREVEERTIDLLDERELTTRAVDVAAHGSFYLEGDNKQLLHLDALRVAAQSKDSPVPPRELRASMIGVLRASHEQADRINQEARNLRNRLVLASALCLLFAVVLVVVQWRAVGTRLLEPPASWSGSSGFFLVVVMFFGGLGALFTAIPAISRVPSDFSPFNLPVQQALLKVMLGPLVAVLGMIIVNTESLRTEYVRTWPGLLLAAAVFGAGQQAVTTYVDKRAGEILTATAPNPISRSD
ncbi:hypothetical protein [Nocardia arizonensis]|uniref:hypothetical protein n=1 Tax=Nocardia arizonensis TaxID=1141647 RepID=UPI0012E2817F|nr:hypothetical protein [Nocardia arizonensis]